MNIKWYGTAAILLEQDGTRLLFDAFLSRNQKIYRPSIDELTGIENILVTHGHLDHIADIPDIMKHGSGKSFVYCTAAPQGTLIKMGVPETRVHRISPGDALRFGPFEVHALQGKHIVYDKRLFLKTLFNPRVLSYRDSLRVMLNENKICVEAGETLVYDISAAEKRILLMGSLNLDKDTRYPQNADLLIFPFQGRSDLDAYALQFIERLWPRKILLDHFDDTFPPISSTVNPNNFITVVRQKYSGIPVICLKEGADWTEV